MEFSNNNNKDNKIIESNSEYFSYGQEELDYLKSKDEKLGAAIEGIGMIKREIMSDPFKALVFNVISQLISKKAAQTVWNRLNNLMEGITPDRIAAIEAEVIQGCGMTITKAECIKGIAKAAIDGRVDFSTLHLLSDDEIIKKLTALNGIGVWTAEMLLIFTLNRPDVVSYNDLAIRKGIMKLYNLDKLTKRDFNEYRHRYSPYGSIASVYLWQISTN